MKPTDRPTVAAAFEAILAFLEALIVGRFLGVWASPHMRTAALATEAVGTINGNDPHLLALRDLVQSAALGALTVEQARAWVAFEFPYAEDEDLRTMTRMLHAASLGGAPPEGWEDCDEAGWFFNELNRRSVDPVLGKRTRSIAIAEGMSVVLAWEGDPTPAQLQWACGELGEPEPADVEDDASDVQAAAELPALTAEPSFTSADIRRACRTVGVSPEAFFVALVPSAAARRAAGETGHGMVVQTRGVDDAGRVWVEEVETIPQRSERAAWFAKWRGEGVEPLRCPVCGYTCAFAPGLAKACPNDGACLLPDVAGAGVRAADDASQAARIRVNRDAVLEGREATRAASDVAGAQAFAAVVEWPALVDTAKGRRETAADYPDDKGALIADLIGERVHVGVDPGGPDETVVHSSEPAFDRLERAIDAMGPDGQSRGAWSELQAAWAAFTTARAAVDVPESDEAATIRAQMAGLSTDLASARAFALERTAQTDRVIGERDSVEALRAFAVATWSPDTEARVKALSAALSKLPASHPAHDAWIGVQDAMGQHRADLQALAADDKAAS